VHTASQWHHMGSQWTLRRCCICFRKYDVISTICQYVFTWRTILPNFIPIRLEMIESWAFFEESCPNYSKKKNKSSNMGSVPAWLIDWIVGWLITTKGCFTLTLVLAASTHDLYSLRVLAASDLFTLARVASSKKMRVKQIGVNGSNLPAMT